MIKDLDSHYALDNVVNIKYSDLEKIFIERNIRMHHMIRNKNLEVKIFKDFEIESNNDFWGRTNAIPSMVRFLILLAILSYAEETVQLNLVN